MMLEHETRLLIGGRLVEAAAGTTFGVIDPATEEVFAEVADGSREDMDRAIDAARRAFDETDWSTNRELRKHCLGQLQAALEEELEAWRAELIRETGTPLATTYGPQLDLPLAGALRYPMKLIDDFEWQRDLGVRENMGIPSHVSVRKEALGVVSAIVPWNYPVEVALNKLGPALAAGNTVVLKPAPDTPVTALRLGRIIAEKTDIPAGVVNVIATSDDLVAQLTAEDPRVDAISFTGSTRVGKLLSEISAKTLKRTFLELGGKSATIVLDDIDDLSDLVGSGSAVTCMHAGQGCALPSRMLIPRSRYDEAVEIAKATYGSLPYGDPNDPNNMMGPLTSASHLERVLGYIEKGKQEGATLAVGGGRPADLERGYFLEPTLFVNVDNSMTIAQEEIFGPVLVMIPYEDEEDAIRIANDSDYGLAGFVAGADVDRALSVAQRIRAGTVMINGSVTYNAEVPFGGYKNSGVGRQCGIEGFEEYLETKSVSIPA